MGPVPKGLRTLPPSPSTEKTFLLKPNAIPLSYKNNERRRFSTGGKTKPTTPKGGVERSHARDRLFVYCERERAARGDVSAREQHEVSRNVPARRAARVRCSIHQRILEPQLFEIIVYHHFPLAPPRQAGLLHVCDRQMMPQSPNVVCHSPPIRTSL